MRPSDCWSEPVSPLISQPVAEACLRIPSYLHILGGRDRGLARSAFAGDVPPEILARQWKDRAPGFIDRLLQSNLAFVRDLLLDGALTEQGLFDRTLLEEALSGEPSKNAFPLEIFSYLTTELWVRGCLKANRAPPEKELASSPSLDAALAPTI